MWNLPSGGYVADLVSYGYFENTEYGYYKQSVIPQRKWMFRIVSKRISPVKRVLA